VKSAPVKNSPAKPARAKPAAHAKAVDAKIPAVHVDADNRIAKTFARLKAEGKKAFIAYICAGDPHLDATVDLVVGLAGAGADVIELGIPYSDPMADGPANQAACERALRAGTTVAGIIAAVAKIRERTQVPLLFFTYCNPVLAFGLEKFANAAHAAGVDGVLPLDLPPEEAGEFLEKMRAAGLANVCLSAPNTPPKRQRLLARASRGFLYYVCRMGVTGERTELPADLKTRVAALKKASPAPVCIGFGISTPEQAALAAGFGDGVIVGSHLVRMIEKHGQDLDLVAMVAGRASMLADAVHAVKA